MNYASGVYCGIKLAIKVIARVNDCKESIAILSDFMNTLDKENTEAVISRKGQAVIRSKKTVIRCKGCKKVFPVNSCEGEYIEDRVSTQLVVRESC